MAKKKIRRNRSSSSRNKNPVRKETVRVKTFIVEKPVYVSAEPEGRRVKYDSKQSRYARTRGVVDREIDEDDFEPRKRRRERAEEVDDQEMPAEQGMEDSLTDDQLDEENVDQEDAGLIDDQGVEEDYSDTGQGHVRSHGLFKNVWWKKGALKGFLVWLAIVILVYLLQAMDMASAENWKRWFFWLVILLLLGMVYEKFLHNRVKI